MTPWRSTPGDDSRARDSSAAASDEPWGARLVLASGVVFGVVSLVNLVATRPDVLGVNARVYYLAGEAVLSGGDLYAVAAPGFSNLPYVYPPLVALVPLLYRLPPGRARTLFVAGPLVANLSVTLPTLGAALGPPVEAPVLHVLGPVLTFGTPRLYGTLLTLGGCVLYRRAGA